jgi:hypothetical protein
VRLRVEGTILLLQEAVTTTTSYASAFSSPGSTIEPDDCHTYVRLYDCTLSAAAAVAASLYVGGYQRCHMAALRHEPTRPTVARTSLTSPRRAYIMAGHDVDSELGAEHVYLMSSREQTGVYGAHGDRGRAGMEVVGHAARGTFRCCCSCRAC